METESLLPKPTYGGIKRYLRRRRYQRLDGDGGATATTGGKKTKMIRSRRRSPRRQWRIKAIPKLTWMVRSPLKMMAKLKNAYTNFMLNSMSTDNIFGTKRIPKADPHQVSKYYTGDAFEARLIFEISKALVASHELYPISPSLRHVTVLPGKGLKEFIKVKVASRKLSYRMLFYSLLFFTFLLRFVFVLTAVDNIDGENKCSSLGCLGKKLRPKILGRSLESNVPEVIYGILDQPLGKDELEGRSDIPQTLEEFMTQMKEGGYDAKTFAIKLREMVTLMEQRTREAIVQEYLYRHVASSGIPKQLHCLALRVANEHTNNAAARLQLPSAELVPALVDNNYFHFVLASDNVLAASVVATSLVRNSLRPQRVVLHIITDRKTYYPMQAWFSLHPLSPAIIEVKALHHFDWFTKGKVPVLEAMEKDQNVRSHFRGGSSAIVANTTEKPKVIAAKLQALSPKYNSVMNHIRIHLPELFSSLNKVVFLDDDTVVQTDLSPLWDIDLNGKVNGAVETCSGEDKLVMSKRLKSYLNFSHPLISQNFDPNECAWAYGMNIFDLDAWRKTNISSTYHHWVEQNIKSDLSLWQLGTLPPGLIAFHGHVHTIDPFWHMLGLGYQENTSFADAETAGVIHFNGRAKPWLDIAFPHLKPLWTKYIDFSDYFIKSCHIRAL